MIEWTVQKRTENAVSVCSRNITRIVTHARYAPTAGVSHMRHRDRSQCQSHEHTKRNEMGATRAVQQHQRTAAASTCGTTTRGRTANKMTAAALRQVRHE